MQENEQSRFVRLTALLAILAMLLAISNLAIPSIFAIGLGGVLLLIPIWTLASGISSLRCPEL